VQFTFYGTSEMVQLRYHYILFVIRYKAKWNFITTISGDICPKCDVSYFLNVAKTIETALGIEKQSLGRSMYKGINLIIESPRAVNSKMQEIFPHAIFLSKQGFVSTVCRFLTVDVLVTSG
jgi:hypothetical protein